ncbi:MAG TPA: neutral/alkaline non-lysosomal ceramidase N-terminal domain-containing protein [Thermomicrobiales bacterium]|nr:neutral/alkaline non-lysosomal ceramidase N-terminal domain-containing protein [Thermomicrobiales bacterium]
MNHDQAGPNGSQGLFFGAARAVITPPAGSDLSGFIARTQPMVGIHDELYARAMVWSPDEELDHAAALVTIDALDLNRESVAEIRSRATALSGIPANRIGVTCTHTHGGAASMPGRAIGRCEPTYIAFLCQAAAGAVAMASAQLAPAAVQFAKGTESTVGINRRIEGGITDPDVGILRMQRRDGTVAGMLVNYACHPVTLGPTNLLATGDYPGYVARSLEAVYPAAHAQFVTGCCGQINTGHRSGQSLRGQGSEWRTYGEAERLGRAVAGAAIQAAEQSARQDAALPVTGNEITPVTVRVLRAEVPMPLLDPPAQDALTLMAQTWQRELNQLEAAGGSPAEIAQRKVYAGWANAVQAGTLPTDISAEVMVIGLGDTALVLLPGESFVEFGLAIKQRAAPRPVLTLAYANGTPGYIPHRSAYPAGGYEVEDAYRYYGYPACFAPEAGEAIVDAACRLLDQL